MWQLLVLLTVSIGVAAAVLVALVVRNRPPEGWFGFLRDAAEAFRSVDDAPTEAADLFSLGEIEPGTGYARLEDLRRRPGAHPGHARPRVDAR